MGNVGWGQLVLYISMGTVILRLSSLFHVFSAYTYVLIGFCTQFLTVLRLTSSFTLHLRSYSKFTRCSAFSHVYFGMIGEHQFDINVGWRQLELYKHWHCYFAFISSIARILHLLSTFLLAFAQFV